MKKTITLIILFFAILNGVQSQTMEKDYYNYKIEQPNPKRIQRFEWRLFPRPIDIKKFNKKVIVTFDRKEWDAFQYMHRKMWLRRDELNKRK